MPRRFGLEARLISTLLLLILAVATPARAELVTGRVIDTASGEAVAEAVVMVQGTQLASFSRPDGAFSIETGDSDLDKRQITAWKAGYSIAADFAGDAPLTLTLEPLPLDDPTHEYEPAEVCADCHVDITAQWQDTAMGRAMDEKLPQKLSFYLGETTDGDFDGLGFGWKLFAPMMGISAGMHAMDLDHYIGTCTNCHARGVTWKMGELEPHRRYDPDTGSFFTDGSAKVFRMDQVADLPVEDGSEGITCDVCHSVEDVRIAHDSDGNLETVDITRMEVIRRGDVKFGPYRDAVSPYHKTAYSPIFEKSEFCAMCHMERADDLEAIGVPSMMTLDEYPVWKANFDAGKTDQQCQDCHMYTGGGNAWTENKAANVGVERDPSTLAGHHWRGSYFDGEMAKRASNLAVNARRVGDELVVTADVANVGAAHMIPGGPPFRQMLLLIDATDGDGNALTPLDAPRADPSDAANANRIIDVGGGYRKYGFFKLWEIEHGEPFPQMPYLGHVGKVYNGSWVTPAFMPMEWMFRYLWIGLLPLLIGLIGWSPLNAMLGRSTANAQNTKAGFFGANVGTIDRLLRFVLGVAILGFAPMPWKLIGIVPLFGTATGWCPTYRLFGGVDTRESAGFFGRNVGKLDRTLRVVVGLGLIALVFVGPRTLWGLLGLFPLMSGLLGWCPTYRLIGNLDTRIKGAASLFGANLGTGDRLLRAAGGLILISLVFWGPKTAWGAIGIVPLFTAIVGWCLPYRFAGVSTCAADGGQGLWKPDWVNLSDRQRRNRLLAGTMMIFVAAVVPKAFAMNMWPVGGFAAERVLYDTRINYGESDTTVYRFAAPEGDAKISARLVYYRHWYFRDPIKGEEYWSTNKWRYLLHEVAVDLPANGDEAIFADAGNRDGSLADMPQVPSVPGTGAMAEMTALAARAETAGE